MSGSPACWAGYYRGYCAAVKELRHAADPRNINQGASMKFVLKCTGHPVVTRPYVAKGPGGWSTTVEDATVFDSAEAAIAESQVWSKEHAFALIPVEVTPPTPGSVRRLI